MRLRVRPLQTLDHEEQRRATAFGQQQLAHGLEDPLASHGGRERVPLGVVVGDVAERQDRRDAAGESCVERHHPRRHLFADAPRVVAVLDVEVPRQQISEGQIGREHAVGDARRLVHLPAVGSGPAREFPDETRLADARLAHQRDELPAALAGARQQPRQRRHLRGAAEHRRLRTSGDGAEARRDRRRPLELPHLDGIAQALHRHRPLRRGVDEARREAVRGRGDQRGAGTRELLHPRREVGRLADGAVVHSEIAADRADDHLARVQADADLHVDAEPPTHVVRVVGDGAVHAQRRVARAHRVVLAGDRRAEEGHDAVAHDLVDRALVPVHRLHHPLQHRVEQGARVLGIAVGEKLERALEICEQHGDLLALPGQRFARAQDLAGEVRGGVGLRRLGSGRVGDRAQARATLHAEFGPGRVVVLAPGTPHSCLRSSGAAEFESPRSMRHLRRTGQGARLRRRGGGW